MGSISQSSDGVLKSIVAVSGSDCEDVGPLSYDNVSQESSQVEERHRSWSDVWSRKVLVKEASISTHFKSKGMTRQGARGSVLLMGTPA